MQLPTHIHVTLYLYKRMVINKQAQSIFKFGKHEIYISLLHKMNSIFYLILSI